MCGSDLLELGGGRYALRIHGKGGRWRDAPIYGIPVQVGAVVDRLKAAGEDLCWPSVPSCTYRADYTARVYKAHVRLVSSIPASERYHCRGDMRGYTFDRKAVMVPSEALGHSRLSVIASHYLYKLVEI